MCRWLWSLKLGGSEFCPFTPGAMPWVCPQHPQLSLCDLKQGSSQAGPRPPIGRSPDASGGTKRSTMGETESELALRQPSRWMGHRQTPAKDGAGHWKAHKVPA